MSRPLQLDFLASAVTHTKLPASRVEVVLIGRSNVGKSSLLNAIAGKKLARVSNTPGRTHVLDYFRVQKSDAALVDCPGYGFAKAPKKIRQTWMPMIEEYLLGRECLAMVMLLVDGEVGPTASDLEMLDWLRTNARPYCVIATKSDKVRPSHLLNRQKEFAEKCGTDSDNIVWVSVTKDVGLTRLRELVRLWLS
ncbi:MAG: ribosome biogenesis GTP-binding protein YsxC [Planctomycetes bacterium]|jgi:GTP-binding protein|nr:ribosome biogenesis GTP-binding protein YsxC [Planctomycetota bacterium]